jgi:hypothetical protein
LQFQSQENPQPQIQFHRSLHHKSPITLFHRPQGHGINSAARPLPSHLSPPQPAPFTASPRTKQLLPCVPVLHFPTASLVLSLHVAAAEPNTAELLSSAQNTSGLPLSSSPATPHLHHHRASSISSAQTRIQPAITAAPPCPHHHAAAPPHVGDLITPTTISMSRAPCN